MIHSILIIGQSNMAGRGIISEAMPIDNKDGRLKVLRNGRWQRMFRPVNPDRSFSGTCLAESFARAYADEHGVDTGIIPCADGGTSLNQWRVGGLLFDNAVYSAKLAMRTSNLAAILWHQGEADCAPELNAVYLEKITVIMVTHDISAALKYASGILHMSAVPEFFSSAEDYKNSSCFYVGGGRENE